MSHYFIVPIKYNQNNYTGPDGFASQGNDYVGLNGFGHEEWNNSPKNDFKLHGLPYRAFHTEGYDVLSKFDDVVMILINNHAGETNFLGIAYYPIRNSAEDQEFISKKLSLEERVDELMALDSVKSRFSSREEFCEKVWNEDSRHIAWRIERDNIIWFDKVKHVDSKKIIGKKFWPRRFSTPKLLTDQEGKDLLKDLDQNTENVAATLQNQIDVGVEIDIVEGATVSVRMNVFERDSKARKLCIKANGCYCHVCDIDFEKMYGELGKGFIHVHHIKPLSEIRASYKVDPVNDLVPVCPNCHAMLHRNKEKVLSIEELKKVLELSVK